MFPHLKSNYPDELFPPPNHRSKLVCIESARREMGRDPPTNYKYLGTFLASKKKRRMFRRSGLAPRENESEANQKLPAASAKPSPPGWAPNESYRPEREREPKGYEKSPPPHFFRLQRYGGVLYGVIEVITRYTQQQRAASDTERTKEDRHSPRYREKATE